CKLDEHGIFTGNLIPLQFSKYNYRKNILSLIVSSDLCSFLTSYQYESIGNPISEAIILNKAYITTNYTRYQHVYADRGYKAIVFPISNDQDNFISEKNVAEVYELLSDSNKRQSIARYNNSIMLKQIENE